jgi:pimeloyl-ACP methyl ester carboxylesterase
MTHMRSKQKGRYGFQFGVMLLTVGALQASHPREGFFDSSGVSIRFVEQGQGPAVVLLHGYTGTGDRHWINTGVFGDLVRDYRVIAMDARGHGMSGKPREASAYGAEMSRDVVRLLDHLGIGHAHVVGFSMGAFVAAHLMVTQPDRLISVTLVAHHPIGAWTSADEQEAEASARDLESETPFRALITAIAPPDTRPSEEEIRRLSAVMTAANDPKALAAYHRGLRTLAVTDADLRAVRVPVLAVIGSEDPTTPRMRELGHALPHLSLNVVEGATHGGERGILRRAEFLTALRAFLVSHARAVTRVPSPGA